MTPPYVNFGTGSGGGNVYVPWDITTGLYTGNSFNFSDTFFGQLLGVCISPDGLKMRVLNTDPSFFLPYVYEYYLTSAWDISTTTFSGITPPSFALPIDLIPRGIFFSPDGLIMYVSGSDGTYASVVYQYNLSMAWDVTTASYSGNLIDLSALISSPDYTYVSLSGDGLFLYATIRDVSIDFTTKVFQLNLSIAYDLSTASYSGHSFDTIGQDSSGSGFSIRPDRTQFFISGLDNYYIYQYDVSSAGNISTGSYTSFLDVSGLGAPNDPIFSPDGMNLYIFNAGTVSIYQFSLS